MKEFPIIFSTPMVQANRAGRKRMPRRVVDMDRLKVVMRRDIQPDFPLNILPGNKSKVGRAGTRCQAVFNQVGAVSCETPSGLLGLRPGEFDFLCPYAVSKTTLVSDGNGGGTWTITHPHARLWVRETWREWHEVDSECGCGDDSCPCSSVPPAPYCYAADCDGFIDEESHEAYGIKWRPSIHMPRWACRNVYTVTKVRIERLQDITEEDAIAEGVEPVERHKCEMLYRNYFTGGYDWPAVESFKSLWYTINRAKRGRTWDDNPWVWVIEYDNPCWEGL